MKRVIWRGLGLGFGLLLPLLAQAGSRPDYARQWPLTLGDADADAGAYRVPLSAEVYRSATLPSLRDVEVFDAAGQPVPSAVFAPEQPLLQPERSIELPWFVLPAAEAGRAQQDIAVISERDQEGRVRRVETRVADAAPTDAQGGNAWLIDASAVREPIVALELDWAADTTALDVVYRVEGSDDLRHWRPLQDDVRLLDLMRDGRRLQQRRIPLQASAKYLRLYPQRSDARLPLSGVRAQIAPAAAAVDWQWEALTGQAVTEQGATYFDFELEGRFPVARADIATAGNDAGEWTLRSRDAKDAPWTVRAGPWVAFQVGGDRSAPQQLGSVVRDRYWRLSSSTATATAPTLRLGYRPEVVVFLAQGKPPYALAAGSARSQRADAPLPQMVDSIRRARGAQWQPAPASLGAAQMLAGDEALVPAPKQRDWKSWLLWALLVGGALLVSGLAFSLLRRGPASG